MQLRFISALFLVLCLLTTGNASAKTQRVLVLNSFNEGYNWTDRIMQGVKNVLTEHEEIDVFVDYMDAKRCSDAEYLVKFHDMLAHKYRFHQFDAILSTDDPALDFLLEYGDTLFPEVPVVFCGINDYHPERIAGRELYTGIFETNDVKKTIDIVLKLQPLTREIVVISDNTISGNYFQEKIKRVESLFSEQTHFRYLENLSLDDLGAQLRDLPPTSIPLWASYLRTPKGVSISSQASVKFVSTNSPHPVYCVWDVVGLGVIGGCVTSPNYQGETAAGRVVSLLAGQSLASMPIEGSPPVYIFDYTVMTQFGLNEDDLPAGAIVRNRPFSFYNEFRTIIWLIIGLGLLLLSIIFGLTYSINERRKFVEALATSEERYRIMIDRTGQLVYDFDLKDTTIRLSGAIQAITGFPAEQFQTSDLESWSNMVHEDDRQRAMAVFDTALENGEDYKSEYRFRKNNGKIIQVEDSGSFIKDSEGKPFRMVGSMKDVSQRKKIEEQLRHGEKMSAIGQLAGGIAHDFNNQLAGVLGYAQMLVMDLEDPELRDYAIGIERAAKRSADLTTQLLAFSRRGKYLAVDLEIHEVVADVISILEHSIDKRIKIDRHFHTESIVTQGDPTQLQNAILNICLNARDAMLDGGVLTLKTKIANFERPFVTRQHETITPGNYAVISITDTGCGMNQEVLSHIFEPFYTTKDVGKGTGMGLASAYGTVNNHKGVITVFSEEKKGTVVKVYLPLILSSTETPSLPQDEEPVKGHAHVLVVDDESTVRNMACKMLTTLGYTVLTAQDGHEAIRIYQEQFAEIDLVVLDMIMPEMGGRETYSAMCNINPDVRVILSSGYSVNGEAQEILNLGVKAFLGKPFDFTELAATVASVLGNQTPN